ncbi:hypothetical protein [Rhodococcus koreensis]|uniref:hypothetical protein n=1 Tax=Rhodococcus koreensis TaxID=99653 RepID=UPI00366C0F4D
MTDQLHEDLVERMAHAIVKAAKDTGDPDLGTVTLTINELAELLERRTAPAQE